VKSSAQTKKIVHDLAIDYGLKIWGNWTRNRGKRF